MLRDTVKGTLCIFALLTHSDLVLRDVVLWHLDVRFLNTLQLRLGVLPALKVIYLNTEGRLSPPCAILTGVPDGNVFNCQLKRLNFSRELFWGGWGWALIHGTVIFLTDYAYLQYWPSCHMCSQSHITHPWQFLPAYLCLPTCRMPVSGSPPGKPVGELDGIQIVKFLRVSFVEGLVIGKNLMVCD